jgi:hypothetical protein
MESKVFVVNCWWKRGSDGHAWRTNVEELNSLLAQGWRVESTSPMSGNGDKEGQFVSLVILTKQKPE